MGLAKRKRDVRVVRIYVRSTSAQSYLFYYVQSGDVLVEDLNLLPIRPGRQDSPPNDEAHGLLYYELPSHIAVR